MATKGFGTGRTARGPGHGSASGARCVPSSPPGRPAVVKGDVTFSSELQVWLDVPQLSVTQET